MLVNVSNSASVFDETVHVLKFSAITSKVCGYMTGATDDNKVYVLSSLCSCHFTGDPCCETSSSSTCHPASSPHPAACCLCSTPRSCSSVHGHPTTRKGRPTHRGRRQDNRGQKDSLCDFL